MLREIRCLVFDPDKDFAGHRIEPRAPTAFQRDFQRRTRFEPDVVEREWLGKRRGRLYAAVLTGYDAHSGATIHDFGDVFTFEMDRIRRNGLQRVRKVDEDLQR